MYGGRCVWPHKTERCGCLASGDAPPSEDTLRRLAEASMGAAPAGVDRTFFVPQADTYYHYGSAVPVLGATRWVRLGSGLIVPAAAASSSPLDHVGVYVTLGEYLEVSPSTLIRDLVRRYSTEEMMVALAAINHYLGDKTAPDDVVEEFLTRLMPGPAMRLKSFMNSHGGSTVVLVGRQALRTSMKNVIGLNASQDKEPLLDVSTAAIMMVHAAGAMIKPVESAGRVVQGVPEPFFMDMVRLALLHRSGDPLGLIERTARVWTGYDDVPRSHGIESSVRELVREATGIEVEDIWAIGFALYAFVISHKPDSPFVLRDINSDMPTEVLASFEELIAADPERLRQAIGEAADPWNFYALERFPVLRVARGLVVLDEEYLLERITNGVYWDVFGHLKVTSGSENLHLRWAESFGEIWEHAIEDQLNALGLATVAEGASYDEHDLQRAFTGHRACDLALDFSTHWCLFEIVRREPHFDTRAHGDFERFEKDIELSVVAKARQLHETVLCLQGEERLLTGVDPVVGKAYQPVVVVAGKVPAGPYVEEYIQERLTAEGILSLPRVRSLAVLDLHDVELLEAMALEGHLVGDVLLQWKSSTLAGMPLSTFAYSRYGGLARAVRIEDRMSAFMPMLIDRLKLRDPPEVPA